MSDVLTVLTQQQYFGSTLLQYVLFLAMVGIALLLGKIVSFAIKNYLRKAVGTTKTKIDDLFLDIIEKPIWLVALIIGMATGFQFLSATALTRQMYYNIINILLVFAVAWFLIKLIDGVIKEMLAPMVSRTDSKLDDQLIPVLAKIAKGTVAVLALLVIISNFGYDVTTLLAGLGIGGLAFAFAAKETIADVFGGFSIFASKPFIVGDAIEIGTVVGTVEEVGLRHTRIRNLDKRMVIVPNSQLAGGIITNITSAPQRKCVWHLGVTYDTSTIKLDKAKKIIVDAINAHPECEDDPIVEFEEFADSSLKILVIFYNKKNDFAEFVRVRGTIGMRIKKEFEKAKIEFAFPTQTIHLKK
ncbi:MAG: mechanosensitive ion channel protein MscL [Candidatus Diapherotrites archaeon]|uniref:Mechanosensitive ion channel protein MscL n=1 Tax=Candidatus Iainarchaeum sp. TaxID=3101447 RepID=A0A2D6M0S1_9ARCH|nr:mechanosensitive ion channel protein MscL [Candidatus Diapherotrites archaeon]|tara:strand:+ start:17778 stop:18848 length:1071 start_codon:yes stop_codon:yes gene_type:complete